LILAFDTLYLGWDAVGMKYISALIFIFPFATSCTVVLEGPTQLSDIGILVREDVVIVDPESADRVTWSELLFQIDKVDVVLLGELHDHAIGHAVQLAVIEDVFDKYPNSVLALEMLERDEQVLVDDYMEDVITADSFESLTHSTNWGAKNGWEVWYQPIIDAVKERGGEVLAANAPRRYVRLARTDGYERIKSLPPHRRSFIDLPEELSGGRYRQRFWEYATHHDEGDEESAINVDVIDPDDSLLPVFRSQQAWDATMAQSVAGAMPSIDRKVILLVGQFHVEYDGGIVQELRRRAPKARVLVISIQRDLPEEEWRGSPAIADFMVLENGVEWRDE